MITSANIYNETYSDHTPRLKDKDSYNNNLNYDCIDI